MATSPAGLLRFRDWKPVESQGNDSTSVALFFPRNRWFSERTAALDVTSTFTVSRRPTARRARKTNRSNVPSFSPATFFCKITKFFLTPLTESVLSVNVKEKNKWEGRVAALPLLLLYPLASAAVDFASWAAAAACFSALAASACRGSASSSICCSATRVLCSS